MNTQETTNEDLFVSIFGFLTNISFFENSIITYNDFELKKIKFDLVKKLNLMSKDIN